MSMFNSCLTSLFREHGQGRSGILGKPLRCATAQWTLWFNALHSAILPHNWTHANWPSIYMEYNVFAKILGTEFETEECLHAANKWRFDSCLKNMECWILRILWISLNFESGCSISATPRTNGYHLLPAWDKPKGPAVAHSIRNPPANRNCPLHRSNWQTCSREIHLFPAPSTLSCCFWDIGILFHKKLYNFLNFVKLV